MANDYKSWEKLVEGDVVDVVAPACGCTKEEIEYVRNFLISINLVPRIPDDLVDESAFALCANTDERRLQHLQAALKCRDSKAVWCLRGGYGSARIVEDLAKVRQPRKSKLFIGFSDITVLHIFLHQKWRWCVMHAPVLYQLGTNLINAESAKMLEELIFGRSEKVLFNDIKPLNNPAKTSKSIYSRIIGGNLCLLQTSIGTSWQVKSKNHIIFIEEVGERGYAVDRMLTHLKQSSILNDAQAIIFGDMVGGLEKDGVSLNEMVINKFAQTMDIPVLRCPDIGHGHINNPLPMGSQVILKLEADRAVLTCNAGVLQ